jgi:hypothetical protein
LISLIEMCIISRVAVVRLDQRVNEVREEDLIVPTRPEIKSLRRLSLLRTSQQPLQFDHSQRLSEELRPR